MTGTAQEYDKWFEEHANWFSSELEAFKQAVPKTGKGIEIGVGTGRFAGELEIETGVEPSEKMAAIASKRGIKVFQGYAEDLPIPDASFDFTLMVTVDCFLQDVSKAFKEAWRITKSGGSVIIGMIDKSSPLGRKYQEHKKNNPFYKSASFHDVEEITNLLEETDFQSFSFWQTLVNTEEEILEQPQKGYGEGGFVVIKALKKKIKNNHPMK